MIDQNIVLVNFWNRISGRGEIVVFTYKTHHNGIFKIIVIFRSIFLPFYYYYFFAFPIPHTLKNVIIENNFDYLIWRSIFFPSNIYKYEYLSIIFHNIEMCQSNLETFR